jgi:hypothetical protein
MVQRTWNTNRLLWQALAASLGAHLLLALFLPVWTAQFSGGLQPIEAISFAPVMRVQIERPSAKSLPAAVPHTTHHARVVSFAHSRAELSAARRKPASKPLTQNGARGRVAAAPSVAPQRHVALYARPAASADVSTQEAAPAPTPQPMASQSQYAVTGAGASDRGGTLPLDATQPPTLDPSVRSALQTRFNAVHVTLIVTVDEQGHTKTVEFQPALDDQTESAIKAMLANATWDAAVCGGGVSCEGMATIRL